MINSKRILAIVPARSGSKGLPGKNIKEFCGKPLIAWSIEQGRGSKYIDRVIVSTDSQEIAQIAETYGAEVPFLRPSELAVDTATSIEVLSHVINFLLDRGESFEYIVLLEPTSPLRDVHDIDGAIEALEQSPKGESIVGVCLVEACHPSFLYELNGGLLAPYIDKPIKNSRRQDLIGSFYFLEGSIYVSRVDSLLTRRSFYHEKTLPWIVSREKSIEIDEYYDFIQAEAVMSAKLRGRME